MQRKWVLVNIGCIECGVSSNIVGVYTDKLRALKDSLALGGCASWREGGPNNFIVFELPPTNTITTEYIGYLGKDA